jgi:hypothetical protein
VPAGSIDVVKVAVPTASSVALARRFPEASRSETVPEGVPSELLTVAVNVTGWPGAARSASEVRVTVMGRPTCCHRSVETAGASTRKRFGWPLHPPKSSPSVPKPMLLVRVSAARLKALGVVNN